MVWACRAYSGISGMAARANVAKKSATNNMIGIYAKVFVSGAENVNQNSMIGAAVNAPAAIKRVIQDINTNKFMHVKKYALSVTQL